MWKLIIPITLSRHQLNGSASLAMCLFITWGSKNDSLDYMYLVWRNRRVKSAKRNFSSPACACAGFTNFQAWAAGESFQLYGLRKNL